MEKRKLLSFFLSALKKIRDYEPFTFSNNRHRKSKQIQTQSLNPSQSLFAVLFVISVTFVTTSCSDNDHPGTDRPMEDSTYYISKSMNIIELQSKLPNEEIKNLSPEDAEKYFGERVQLSQAEKLIFWNDSLLIVKPGNLSSKYKLSWKKDDLYLYNDITNTWEYCGKRNGESAFILNTGLYWIKGNNMNGTLSILGQSYSLLSYGELLEYLGGNSLNANKQIVWLKMQYVFDQKPEVKL